MTSRRYKILQYVYNSNFSDKDFNDISPPSSPEVKKKKESPKGKPKMGPKSKQKKPSYVDSDDEGKFVME